jgi:hypothetical protein
MRRGTLIRLNDAASRHLDGPAATRLRTPWTFKSSHPHIGFPARGTIGEQTTMSDLDERARFTAAEAEALRLGYRIEVELDDDKTTHLAMAHTLASGSRPRPICRRATALEAIEAAVEMLRSQG